MCVCVCLQSLCNSHNVKWNRNGNSMWISMTITLFFLYVRLFIRLLIRLLMLSMSHNPLSFLVRLWEFRRSECVCLCVYFSILAFFRWFQRHTVIPFAAWPGIKHKQHTQIFWLCSTCLTFLFLSLVFNCIFVCTFVCLCFFMCVSFHQMLGEEWMCVQAYLMLAKDGFFVFAKIFVTEKRINTKRNKQLSYGQSQERILSLLFSE